MNRNPEEAKLRASSEDVAPQPLRNDDTSIEPEEDPAQAEWDRTTALDDGVDPDDLDAATGTGDDPAQVPTDDEEIPAADLPVEDAQPETRGNEPLVAELGDDGEGDLAPEDI